MVFHSIKGVNDLSGSESPTRTTTRLSVEDFIEILVINWANNITIRAVSPVKVVWNLFIT